MPPKPLSTGAPGSRRTPRRDSLDRHGATTSLAGENCRLENGRADAGRRFADSGSWPPPLLSRLAICQRRPLAALGAGRRNRQLVLATPRRLLRRHVRQPLPADVDRRRRDEGRCASAVPRDKKIAATTVVADRASGVVALVILLGLGLLLRYRDALPGFVFPLILVCLLMSGTGGACRRSIRAPTICEVRQPRRTSAYEQCRSSPTAPWPRVLGWALVVQGLNVAAVAAAAQAIGVTITTAGLLVATEMASLAAALPLSVAGVGVREASLPMLLAADGVPRSAAIALGLTWSAIVLRRRRHRRHRPHHRTTPSSPRRLKLPVIN